MTSETLELEDIRCLDVDLATKLAAFVETLTATRPTMANLYGELIARLECAGAGDEAPDVGQPMPPFLLPDTEGCLVSSDDLLADGPLVVSFNRGHWCEFCQLEILEMAEIHPEIRHLGGEVVSITPDRASETRRWRDRDQIPFAMLTDLDCGYALACGLMIALGPAVRDLYRSAGVDLPRFQGNEAHFVPIPATYVIARGGVIAARFVAADFRRRMSPEAIGEALRPLCENDRKSET
jgi:peroxiredoxin